MSVEKLQEMAKVFYVIACALLGISCILFFRFRIWKMIGDLLGVNKKRGIRAIVEQERERKKNSQAYWEMESLLGEYKKPESVESWNVVQDIKVLEPESLEETCCLIEKMEYMESVK